ncbi:phospholipid-transporting ATPase ABCA3-like [Physella acuta]|uniref:phospholipid-transporting ATPase ABCA3-like n=1 Tax=Physella acuta TaxID=109671 RepID=UPI0027DDD72D|nr:phospholipid-transporting ATPase ABCA3-like [Physella acuta]
MYLSVCCSKDKNKAAPYMFCQDQEVNDEGARVETLAQSPESNNEVLLMVNVEKTYSNCYYTNRAVYPTSLGMSPNESFGLLGKSNSGKTSILKMIIGDTQPTAGDIYVLKHNVKTELTKASTKLGYCPENNALHDMLTGRETLYLYGRIRGVPDRSLEDVVEVVIDFITLRPYENKVVRRYSHNNKRKLSLGIAIMGKPVLLVLDMPTVGMGRMSRRIMWNVLHLIQISGHSLIIATRSIEECEALCMRMAFMLNGRLITIGSPQDLKLRYGQGYWVVLQLNVTKSGSSKILDDVIVFLHRTVQSTHVTSVAERVIIREADSCEIHYPQPVSLVSLFRSLILAKERFNLRAFSVQQLTLRHIFLMLINDRASF